MGACIFFAISMFCIFILIIQSVQRGAWNRGAVQPCSRGFGHVAYFKRAIYIARFVSTSAFQQSREHTNFWNLLRLGAFASPNTLCCRPTPGSTAFAVCHNSSNIFWCATHVFGPFQIGLLGVARKSYLLFMARGCSSRTSGSTCASCTYIRVPVGLCARIFSGDGSVWRASAVVDSRVRAARAPTCTNSLYKSPARKPG